MSQHAKPAPETEPTPPGDAGAASSEDVEGGTLAVEPPPTAEEIARWKARAAEADGLEERLKRAQADFVNESRRIQRQSEQDRRFAVEGVVKDLVPVAEGLDGALASPECASAPGPLREGITLVLKQFEEVLKRYGVELLRPSGVPFDPLSHEAVMMVDRIDLAPGTVASLLRPGLRLHGRVLRPAQVTVARAPAAPPAPPCC